MTTHPATLPDLAATGITRGLIIRSPFIEKILGGLKTWEMRSRPTHVRGPVALIQAGSGMIVGTATITDSLPPLPQERWRETFRYHRVGGDMANLRKWNHPWKLADVRKLPQPIPYTHPRGAVVWVALPAPGSTRHEENPTFWWPLWKHLHDAHNLILVDDELNQIARAVDEARRTQQPTT